MRLTTLLTATVLLSAPAAAYATLDAVPAAPAAAESSFTVVIDPGHGGEDTGTAFGRGARKIYEKNVTLALARRTAADLRAQGFTVYLTRDVDRELPLASRTAFANRVHADLFLSIHMNSTSDGTGTSGAEGVETYILNNATDASSRRLATLENSVLSGYETDTPEATDVSLILKDLRLDANLSASERLACNVQESLVAGSRRRDRGVRQALFHVLLGADMPSALVEAGFLSSARDRSIVLSARGQKAIGLAIARGIEAFRRARRSGEAASAGLSRCKVD